MQTCGATAATNALSVHGGFRALSRRAARRRQADVSDGGQTTGGLARPEKSKQTAINYVTQRRGVRARACVYVCGGAQVTEIKGNDDRVLLNLGLWL